MYLTKYKTWNGTFSFVGSAASRGGLDAAAAADAEWNPQENGKPSSTEYIGMRSLHQREGPEKMGKMENSYSARKN